jgi:alkyldihydroxyacetonephosphate synthase
LAIETLRAVKNTLDPGNVMNPGVLVPESEKGLTSS